MSRVERIESEIEQMSAEELSAFRSWFAEFDAQTWDEAFARDAVDGRFDELAAQALLDHKSGLSTKV